MDVQSLCAYFVAASLGAATWIPLEYWIHRRLGHETRVSNPFLVEHREHHRVRLYFAPSWKKFVAALLVIGSMTLSLSRIFSVALAATYAIALASQYLFYEFLHRRLHTHAPKTRLGLVLRKHHLAHHYGHAGRNFGVTLRVLDRVFGTLSEPERVRIPKVMANDWLLDPERQHLKPQYSRDFSVT